MQDWNFAELWNASLNYQPRTEYQPRERIWASELYNAPVDLFLKLKGTNPSNVPDRRSMLKFDAGNKTEFILRLMLLKIGILKGSQKRVEFNQKGLLQVTGKVDFEAGGDIVENTAVNELLELVGYPEDLIEQGKEIQKNILKLYPKGLKDKIIELKSVASFGMNRILLTQQPIEGHELQAFHYAYNTGKDVELLYVCRDDWRIWSKTIKPNDEVLLKKYLDKIKRISDSYYSGEQPPKEPLIIYDELAGRFDRNFSVQYSSYLTMLYGFKHAEEYADWFKSKTKGWNAALNWVAKGKKVTPKKQEALTQIEQAGFPVAPIIKTLVELASKGIVLEEEAEE